MKMNIRILLLLAHLFLLSCESGYKLTKPKTGSKIETIEYKNFKGERITESGISMVKKYYNEGRLDSILYLDIEGKAIHTRDQNTKWKFEYDDNGNFIRQVAYNQNDEICDLGYYNHSAIEAFEYNAKNQLVKRKKLDKSGNTASLIGHQCATIEYSYNNQGQLISEKNFNSKGHYIQDGRSFKKYTYNADGSLSNGSYLYTDSAVNLSTDYTYQDNLIKEATFNRKGDCISYYIYHYNKEKIAFIETWDEKKDSVRILKEEVDLELDGWRIKPSDLKKIKIQTPYVGAFDIKIDQDGRILNIEPILIHEHEYIGFYVEFYEDMRSIKLERDLDHPSPKQDGKLFFYSLRNGPYFFNRIKNILHPSPSY
jgi:YD repeat-containing protein